MFLVLHSWLQGYQVRPETQGAGVLGDDATPLVPLCIVIVVYKKRRDVPGTLFSFRTSKQGGPLDSKKRGGIKIALVDPYHTWCIVLRLLRHHSTLADSPSPPPFSWRMILAES